MKAFVFIFCFFLCTKASAQLSEFEIPFDDTTSLDWTSWITIDTINYHNNEWQVGKPNKKVFNAAYDYPNALITNSNFPCRANDTSSFIFIIPGSELFDFYLTLKYRLDLDTGDVVLVEGSLDGGLSWADLSKDSTMNIVVRPISLDSSLLTSGWDSLEIEPVGFITRSDSVLLRFTLITGADTMPRDGWMIDDIELIHYGDGVANIPNKNAIQIVPNPARDKVQLTWLQSLWEDSKLNVFNTIGTNVFSDKISKGSIGYMIQVRDWDKGIYFIELDDGKGGRVVKKLVVE